LNIVFFENRLRKIISKKMSKIGIYKTNYIMQRIEDFEFGGYQCFISAKS
jgi:hypothetical protein